MAIKNILVIRFRRIGDALLFTPLCCSLKRSFPQASVHYVLNEAIAPLFLHDPHIDQIITFGKKEEENFADYIRKVRRVVCETKYDVIIDIRSTFKTSLFSVFSSRTPYRICYKKAYNVAICNGRVPLDGKKDIIDQILDLLGPLEKKYSIVREREYRVHCTEDEKRIFR